METAQKITHSYSSFSFHQRLKLQTSNKKHSPQLYAPSYSFVVTFVIKRKKCKGNLSSSFPISPLHYDWQPWASTRKAVFRGKKKKEIPPLSVFSLNLKVKERFDKGRLPMNTCFWGSVLQKCMPSALRAISRPREWNFTIRGKSKPLSNGRD